MGLFRNHLNQYTRAATDGHSYCTVPGLSGKNKDLIITGFPVMTMVIIAAYTLFFFVTPEDMVDRLCSLPLEDFSLSHLILTTVAGTILHQDFGHLLMNMILLWAFGALLEPRLTPGQYLLAILLGGVLSRLISLNLLVAHVDLLGPSFYLLQYPPAGASGAIAGLMGCFVMRYGVIGRSGRGRIGCHPLKFCRVPISATILIGLFFVRDVVGHPAPAFGIAGMADFWGHMGGLLGCLVLALVSTLQDGDPGEKQQDEGERLDSGLEGGEDYRYQQEMAIRAPADASIRHYFLPIEPPFKETHQGTNTAGCSV